jgi:hypothetical protein
MSVDAILKEQAVGHHARDTVTGGANIDEFTAVSLADATWQQTVTTVRQWLEHCTTFSIDPLPVSEAALKAYEFDLARKGRRLSTICTRPQPSQFRGSDTLISPARFGTDHVPGSEPVAPGLRLPRTERQRSGALAWGRNVL